MRLHPKINDLLPLLTKHGFEVHHAAGMPDGGPSCHVTLTKSIHLPGDDASGRRAANSVTMAARVDLDQANGYATITLRGILPDLSEVTRPSFSFPHPHFDEWLQRLERAASAAVFEVSGLYDREYLLSVMQSARSTIVSGYPNRGVGLLDQVLAVFPPA